MSATPARSRVPLVVVGLVALAAGFAAGRLFPAGGRPATQTADPNQAQLVEEVRRLGRQVEALSRREGGAARSLTAGEIQTVVRAELDRGEAERQAPGRKDPPPATPRQTPELAAGLEIVDTAIGAHSWKDDDRDRLRDALRKLDRPQREAVVNRLLTAINEGRVRLATDDGQP